MTIMKATDTTNTKRAVRQPRRRRKRRGGWRDDDPIYYVVEVVEWEWSLTIGVNQRADRNGPYSDYRHLNLRGNLLYPARAKARGVGVTLMPDRRLNEGERERDEPHSCGSMHLHRGYSQALLPTPLDALPSILQIACADRLRYVVITGDRLCYGHGLVRTYRLQRTLDKDDLPTGDWINYNANHGNPLAAEEAVLSPSNTSRPQTSRKCYSAI